MAKNFFSRLWTSFTSFLNPLEQYEPDAGVLANYATLKRSLPAHTFLLDVTLPTGKVAKMCYFVARADRYTEKGEELGFLMGYAGPVTGGGFTGFRLPNVEDRNHDKTAVRHWTLTNFPGNTPVVRFHRNTSAVIPTPSALYSGVNDCVPDAVGKMRELAFTQKLPVVVVVCEAEDGGIGHAAAVVLGKDQVTVYDAASENGHVYPFSGGMWELRKRVAPAFPTGRIFVLR